MARGRPKKEGLWAEKDRIRVMVWESLKSQGYALPIELTNGKGQLIRGQHSVKVAVAAVAKELECSETTVWNAWSGFDPLSYEWGREKDQHDFEMNIAYECRAEEALQLSSASSATRRNSPTMKLRTAPKSWKGTSPTTTTISYYK